MTKLTQPLENATKICQATGQRLTLKRQAILKLLWAADLPMSAYELRDAYNLQAMDEIKAMSVYRILEFLESVNLAHRLHSINKYIACNKDASSCQHHHGVRVICKHCQKSAWLENTDQASNEIFKAALQCGFTTVGAQLELLGVCKRCQTLIQQ